MTTLTSISPAESLMILAVERRLPMLPMEQTNLSVIKDQAIREVASLFAVDYERIKTLVEED